MKKPLIWGHRGASAYAPENTLFAFQKAVEQKADGVELDIQLTKDGHIVVIHDEWIDRTSDGKGWVKDMTLAELRRFNYNRTHPEYEHADIPTMEEVLDLLKPTDLTIDIELKTGVLYYDRLEEKTYWLAEEYGLNGRIIYSSFNHYSLQKLKTLCPDVKIGLLMGADTVRLPEDAERLHAYAVHPPEGIVTKEYVEKCHAHRLKVNTWTVDNPDRMRQLVAIGVDAFITDCPDSGRRVTIANNWQKYGGAI